MSIPVTVRKVENKANFKVFFEFPWSVYKDDSNWVPPLLSMRRELLDKKKNPSWTYLEGDYYVAWRGDRPVGTIAAFVNKNHNKYHEENIAFFGFFEVYDDQEAATALLKTAVDWARGEGYDAVRGPQSFTVMDECGLLVDGFERPILMMPYNPPYYQVLIENAGLGFAKVMDTFSFYHNRQTAQESGIIERLRKLITRIKERQRITIRGIDRKHLDTEFALFKDIYNSAWEKNWGFTPFTEAEMDALVKALGDFFDPDLACFAYVGEEPIGFLIAVPDMNQVIQKAYPRPGVPEWVTLMKALWYWKIRPCINWVRVPLMGVKDGYRNQGVDLAMYHFLLESVIDVNRYQHMDMGWILETNTAMIQTSKGLGTEAHRTYRFYETALKSAE